MVCNGLETDEIEKSKNTEMNELQRRYKNRDTDRDSTPHPQADISHITSTPARRQSIIGREHEMEHSRVATAAAA